MKRKDFLKLSGAALIPYAFGCRKESNEDDLAFVDKLLNKKNFPDHADFLNERSAAMCILSKICYLSI